MNFFSLIILLCSFFLSNFSFSQTSQSYKSLSYADTLQIFTTTYGIRKNPIGGNLDGALEMKNCFVKYSFDWRQKLFSIDVKRKGQKYTYRFWGYLPAVSSVWGTPALPLIQLNKVVGFVAVTQVGIDCETQGCWRDEVVRLFVRHKSLTIQAVGPEPSPYIRPSVETIICSRI